MGFIKFVLSVISFSVIGCQTMARDTGNYPPEWWVEIPRDQAKSWEILPQDAKQGEVILSKRTELGILSNFAATPFVLQGKKYASVEGFWQMMKYPENDQDPRAHYPGVQWKFTRDQVASMVAFDAKDAGELANKNMKIMKIDWVSFEGKRFPYKPVIPGEHYKWIRLAMEEKLNQNPEVKRILLATGDLILMPDHHQGPNEAPAWKYFQIWMEIRSTLN